MDISRFRRLLGLAWLSSSKIVALLGCVALCSSTACVTRSTYDTLMADFEWERTERARLEQEIVEGELEATLQQDRIVELESTTLAMADSQVAIEGQLADAYGDLQQLHTNVSQLADLATRRAADLQRLQGTWASLVREFSAEIASGEMQVDALQVGLRISLSDELLFESGSAALIGRGQKALERIGSEIAVLPDRIEIEGHTDAVPISERLTERYPTNWELAGARSSRVARMLIEAGAAADRMAAVSYGEHRPVASNDAAEGRARNRRIEIRLIPSSAEESMGDAAITAMLAPAIEAAAAVAAVVDGAPAAADVDADPIGAEIAAMMGTEAAPEILAATADAAPAAAPDAAPAADEAAPAPVSTQPPAKAEPAEAEGEPATDRVTQEPPEPEAARARPKLEAAIAPEDLPDSLPVETYDAY